MAGKGERAPDIYSRLLKQRIVFVGDAIDDQVANVVMAQLLFLQFEDKRAETSLYLNSPGGSITASLAIYDTMEFVENEIATYALSQVSGTALLLLCAGTRGKRFAVPEARFAFGDIFGTTQADARDAAVQAEEIAKLRKAIFDIFAKHTGNYAEWIATQFGKGQTFGTEEALRIGLIDKVLEKSIVV